MLEPERNAYDGDAEDHTRRYVHHRNLNTSDKNPDYIHKDGKATVVIGIGDYLPAERPKCKPGHLEQLITERYTNDSDAEKQPDHKIIEADNQTSEQNPKYVSQEPHSKQFLFRRSETG